MHDLSRQSIASSFDQVDSILGTDALMDYLDAQSASDFWRQLKRESIAALEFAPGHFALDVGCGLGDEVRAMGAIVGATGRVTGIDSSRKLIGEALARTAAGCPAQFTVGDAHQLPFSEGTFDAIRIERTLRHRECPLDVVAEMFRVAKPGAKAIAIEPDWDTLVVAAAPLEVTRAICRRWADRIRHPAIGREISALFHEAGFDNVAVHPSTSLILSLAFADQQFESKQMVQAAVKDNQLDPTVASAWLHDLHARDRAGRFVAAVTYFAVAGQKPRTSISCTYLPVTR